MDRIACFFTSGYTEAGAMQSFLERINSLCLFFQCFPNKPRYRKKNNKIELQNLYSGLTGSGLIDKVVEYCGKYPQNLNGCKGIVIEDDSDNRLDDISLDELEQLENKNSEKIHKILGKQIPIVYLYAVPEVEAWFVADWNNGFGWLCKSEEFTGNIKYHDREYYENRVAVMVKKEILDICENDIENYTRKFMTYKKLSEEIARILREDVPREIIESYTAPKELKESFDNTNRYNYSKIYHGESMLRRIDPNVVNDKCRQFFRRGYLGIKKF